MLCGYVRVSTRKQNTIRQEVLMHELGVEKLYCDKESGKSMERQELNKMLDFVREGYTVVVESISRFARNTRDLLDLLDQLSEKGVQFISKKENIDTNTSAGRFMLTVMGAMAELERENILERQAEGIAIAKAEGRFNGRPKVEIENFEELYSDWKENKLAVSKICKANGIARSTWYRKVNEFEESQADVVIDF